MPPPDSPSSSPSSAPSEQKTAPTASPVEVPGDSTKARKDLSKDVAKSGRDQLKDEVESTPHLPKDIYRFQRSFYEDPKDKTALRQADNLIDKALKNPQDDKELKIVLKGTADKVLFRIDYSTGKARVNLENGPQWQADFLRAMQALQSKNTFPELGSLDFSKQGLYAIHDLSLELQQKFMNHAIAYLRAERLQKDLQEKFKDKHGIIFDIQTEWMDDLTTRVATLVDVQYQPKSPPIVKPGPDPEPPPVAPPDPEKQPFDKDEIVKNLLQVENPNYVLSTETIFRSGGLIEKEKMMQSTTLVVENSGRQAKYDTFFITSKGNNVNPKYYLLVNQDDPYEIAIGTMQYDNALLTSEAEYGPVTEVINLDKKNRTATLESMKNIFNSLP